MNSFLRKIGIACALGLGLHLAAGYFCSGKTDAFYLRFTSPRQSSLIIGSSRAAQGFMPSVLKDSLGLDVFNFGFTMDNSPYGEVYNHAILEKLDPDSKDGVFILVVDPWTVSSTIDPKVGVEEFGEKDLVLGKMHFFNMNPNYEYLILDYSKGWGSNVLEYYGAHPSEVTLHTDGWLEVVKPMDDASIKARTDAKLKHYREVALPGRVMSAKRLADLETLITTLDQHGDVYLVRPPVVDELLEIENQLSPDFDSAMQFMAEKTHAKYLSMLPFAKDITYTDGNHISRNSAQYATALLANWIKH